MMTTTTTATQHPVVLRFEGMFPDQLDGYEGHRQRIRGDDGNIVRERSHLNRLLIGDEDWAETTRAEVEEMRLENFAEELEALKRRKRRKDIARRLAEGPKDPWRKTRHGPMREVILTANSAWFRRSLFEGEAADAAEIDRNEREFEALAVGWLKAQFGDDVIHARADRDEIAYHIHAVILPRETKTVNGATRRMLQPSKFAIIEDYEKAQDSVGAWFKQAGLVRGERRAAAVRAARTAGVTPPPKRRHTRPHEWRRAEEARLALLDNAVSARSEQVQSRSEAVSRREAAVAARERALVREQAALATRDSALARKADAVAQREADADETARDAHAVIRLAEQWADGDIAIAADRGGPPTATPTAAQPAPTVARVLERVARGGLAARALGAFARLQKRLRREASDALQERERQVERDARAILSVDAYVVEIAGRLPAYERSVIERLRQGIAAPLTRLKGLVRRAKDPSRGPDERD
jgi:hypothetical protein